MAGVRLLKFYPQLTKFSCAECQKYVYDMKTGDRKKICNGEVDWERPPQVAPPCHECPKEAPEREREHVLNDRNRRAYQVYLLVRATGGACLSTRERRDLVLLRNLALVDGVVRAWERLDLAKSVSLMRGGA